MRPIYTIWLLLFFLAAGKLCGQSELYLWKVKEGRVSFVSRAPLETIEASSNVLEGLLNTATGAFAFTLFINTFEGFNSPLQQDHFYENYLETDRFPKSTFSGRLIESVDLTRAGSYKVRAKGLLDIHGVTVERIITVDLRITEQWINATSTFLIPLSAHNISIPRIVRQKIAEEIEVSVQARFQR